MFSQGPVQMTTILQALSNLEVQAEGAHTDGEPESLNASIQSVHGIPGFGLRLHLGDI